MLVCRLGHEPNISTLLLLTVLGILLGCSTCSVFFCLLPRILGLPSGFASLSMELYDSISTKVAHRKSIHRLWKSIVCLIAAQVPSNAVLNDTYNSAKLCCHHVCLRRPRQSKVSYFHFPVVIDPSDKNIQRFKITMNDNRLHSMQKSHSLSDLYSKIKPLLPRDNNINFPLMQ